MGKQVQQAEITAQVIGTLRRADWITITHYGHDRVPKPERSDPTPKVKILGAGRAAFVRRRANPKLDVKLKGGQVSVHDFELRAALQYAVKKGGGPICTAIRERPQRGRIETCGCNYCALMKQRTLTKNLEPDLQKTAKLVVRHLLKDKHIAFTRR